MAELRMATSGGWAIGGERFEEQIVAKLRRRATPPPSGRPPKASGPRRPIGFAVAAKLILTPINALELVGSYLKISEMKAKGADTSLLERQYEQSAKLFCQLCPEYCSRLPRFSK